MIYRNSKVKWV